MMMLARARTQHDHRVLVVMLGALIGLAWVALWLWGQSPYARWLSHHSLEEVRGGGALMLVFVAGWLLMTVAMMLPTSLPLIGLFHTVVRRRADKWLLTALLIVGYLGAWTLFGAAVYAADGLVHGLVERLAWLEANAWALGAGTVTLAGLYQFSPLKYRCLDACRSPFSFIMGHWQGRHERRQALRLGIDHGLFCIGCCWSLMLLMFAVGVGNVGWMLALGTAMAVEKNLPWGRRLSAPLGLVLLIWSMALALPHVAGRGGL